MFFIDIRFGGREGRFHEDEMNWIIVAKRVKLSASTCLGWLRKKCAWLFVRLGEPSQEITAILFHQKFSLLGIASGRASNRNLQSWEEASFKCDFK